MVWWLLACVCTESPPPHSTVRQGSVQVTLSDAAASLQTPIIDLRGAQPQRRVLLVGVVHVADPDYYADLAKHLTGSTVVLHEGLLADDDTPLPPEEDAADAAYLDALHAGGLVPQGASLVHDDRFVRADLTVRQLEEALKRAGASPTAIHEIVHARDRDTITELFASAAEDPRRRSVARLALVKSIAAEAPPHGPDADLFWDVVIGERNAAAVGAVTEQSVPDLALIYGADHTADLAARLQRLGFEAVDETWVTAIEVPYAEVQLGRIQVEQLLRR